MIKYCIDVCPYDAILLKDWFGDTTTSKRICVVTCPTLPLRFADPLTKLCATSCPPNYVSDPISSICANGCPSGYFAYEPDRKCVIKCPNGYFGDNTVGIRKCYNSSALCGTKFGDPYLNLCVTTCTGPSPVSLFGSGDDCV